MKLIDMRSDTVTQPTFAMRQAMATAQVGDDVYGDDPTVNELELLAAKMLGKEKALFIPTGTFGNQLAIFTHCQRSDEVIIGEESHIVWHENGAAAAISGVQIRAIAGNKGILDPKEIEARIRVGTDIHAPRTGLICLENAHSNGRVIPLDIMKRSHAVAQKHHVPVHLDGARIFNAATHLKCDVRNIARFADTVMFCLSKGLAAPVGSILTGTSAFVDKARYNRKMHGGGWRQAGVLAAPGILALKEMTLRLGEDHENALYLAKEISKIPGYELDLESVQINMVWFKVPARISIEKMMSAFAHENIKVGSPHDGKMRLVTHCGIDRVAVDRVLDVMRSF